MSRLSEAIVLDDISQESFKATITSSDLHDLSEPSLQSIWSTISVAQSLSSTPSRRTLRFLPSVLSIATACGEAVVFDDESAVQTLQNLGAFVRSAQELANANACSSVLAGQSSESDDYGDVGVYIAGPSVKPIDDTTNNSERAKAALSALGLGHLITDNEISPIELADATGLPTAFRCKSSDMHLTTLRGVLKQLDLSQTFAFALDCSGERSAVVLYVLLGRVQGCKAHAQSNGHAAWAGLLGVGIQS